MRKSMAERGKKGFGPSTTKSCKKDDVDGGLEVKVTVPDSERFGAGGLPGDRCWLAKR